MLIAIVIGMIAGASLSNLGGAVVGGLIAWLTVRSVRQQNEIDALRKAALAEVASGSEAAFATPATPPLHSPMNEPMAGTLLHLDDMPGPESAHDAAVLEGVSDARRDAFSRAGPDTLPFAAGVDTSGASAAMAADAATPSTTEIPIAAG
ncbi:MAG: hypothetical protein ABI281_10980, partial [Caldimonas sp.]